MFLVPLFDLRSLKCVRRNRCRDLKSAALGLGVRSVVVGTYVVFYAVESDRVVVALVLDGRRDIDAEFQR